MTAKQAEQREPLDLKPIKDRASEATEGPWTMVIYKGRGTKNLHEDKRWFNLHARPYDPELSRAKAKWHVCIEESEFKPTLHDADFIAHARQDIPALVAEVEQLRKENDELRRKLKKGRDAAEAIFKAHTP